MHLEFLVEGQIDLTVLSIMMPKVIGEYGQPHTWKIHKHRGIGSIPENPAQRPNHRDQSLLHNLPAKLRAYGAEGRDDLLVVVLVDLDDRESCLEFKQELLSLLQSCPTPPNALFRIAIEELEAWFLGDQGAILAAFPEAKIQELADYVQDSQCGTWEKLADIVHVGGSNELRTLGKRSTRVLAQKRRWAAAISPHLDVDRNVSSSFKAFIAGVRGRIAPQTA
ncbi:DUF4276 family protein [Shinella sp. M27]|uniref:DUF4276 family protein n=1 Tax=Shinella sp. M27 TaxID=3368614 RepID=UPI003B9F8293